MEKKKLLLVAVSVGVFLVIVIGLSILIFLPKNREPAVNSQTVVRSTPEADSNGVATAPATTLPPPRDNIAAGSDLNLREEPATLDAMDMLRNREDFQGLQSPPPQTNNGSNLVIEVPHSTSVGVPSGSTGTSDRATSSLNVNQAAIQTPVRSVSQPSQSQAVATRANDNFWVQAGSFSTQIRAEDVRETLSAKGITAIIENRDINGQNFFRVRIGPYTSKNEADYWLTIIQNINGFEGSQIWQTRTER
jgi:DedD protein